MANLKELLEKLKSEEDGEKAATQLEALLKGMVEDATKSLKEKNQELRDELKDAKGDRQKIVEALGDAAKDPAGLKARLEHLEELEREQAEKDGNVQKQLELQQKKFEREVAKLKEDHKVAIDAVSKELAEEKAFTEELLVDNGLTEQLTAAGVPSKFIKAARALLKPNASVERDGDGGRKATIKTEDGDAVAIKDFVSRWVESDEGKHFVEAPDTGGGGGGHPANGAAKKKNPWSDDAFNMTEQARIMRSDRKLAERLAREAGKHLPVDA
jgi:hypothetical protein